jgi:hypothetical protein
LQECEATEIHADVLAESEDFRLDVSFAENLQSRIYNLKCVLAANADAPWPPDAAAEKSYS